MQEPQEGFGRFLTHDEIRNMISSPNVRTYILSLQSQAIGFYVLDIEHQEAKIVGVSKEGREIARSLEIDAYGLLDEAMMDTACAFGITHLTGEVREGLQANTAKSKHLIRGWKETETVKVHDGHPYRKLERDVMATLPHHSSNPKAEITIASSAEFHPVYKDVIRKPLAGYLYILGLPVESLPQDLQSDPTLWSNCAKLLHEQLTGLLINQDIPEDEKHIAQLALTQYEERARVCKSH